MRNIENPLVIVHEPRDRLWADETPDIGHQLRLVNIGILPNVHIETTFPQAVDQVLDLGAWCAFDLKMDLTLCVVQHHLPPYESVKSAKPSACPYLISYEIFNAVETTGLRSDVLKDQAELRVTRMCPRQSRHPGHLGEAVFSHDTAVVFPIPIRAV
jgi:hypothetical protein